jgi:uncharacterized protein (DUF697 family)
MPLGLRARDVLGVWREAQGAAASTAPIVVIGLLADELARGLRAGSEDGGRAVAAGGDHVAAAVLVVVLAGTPGVAEERALREAARSGTPVVVVQTDTRTRVSLPYVLPTEIVDCSSGQGFPIPEIADALATGLGRDGVSLAARLPVLRDPVCRRLIGAASRQAAVVGLVPWSKVAHFPAMAMIQTRLVLDLATAHGQGIDSDRAPEVAAAVSTGLGLRALARRLPARVPLIGAVTGYFGTRAIGEAALRRHAMDSDTVSGSVRPRT